MAPASRREVEAVGRADADVRDRGAVRVLLERIRPHAVVHTAYVQDDWDVTATGAAHVAQEAARVGARPVLVSSDVVFGGSASPYPEAAPTDPASAYGEAKVAAETAVPRRPGHPRPHRRATGLHARVDPARHPAARCLRVPAAAAMTLHPVRHGGSRGSLARAEGGADRAAAVRRRRRRAARARAWSGRPPDRDRWEMLDVITLTP